MIESFTNEVNHSIRLSIKNSFVLLHQTDVSMGTEPLLVRQNTRSFVRVKKYTRVMLQ